MHEMTTQIEMAREHEEVLHTYHTAGEHLRSCWIRDFWNRKDKARQTTQWKIPIQMIEDSFTYLIASAILVLSFFLSSVKRRIK